MKNNKLRKLGFSNQKRLNTVAILFIFSIFCLVSIPIMLSVFRINMNLIIAIVIISLVGLILSVFSYFSNTSKEDYCLTNKGIVTSKFGLIDFLDVKKITHSGLGNILIIKMKSGKKIGVYSITTYGSKSMKVFNNFKIELSKIIDQSTYEIEIVHRVLF